jgi:hypothetical protein
MFAVIAYLVAACSANVAVTLFGYAALPFTAAALIPFDMTARDVLHDKWHGNWLWLRMAALVASGSVLAWLLCNGSPAVCIASAVSFCVSGMIDTLAYHLLRSVPKWQRMNASNVASSVADSVCFPLVAFGAVSLTLATSQVFLKVAGGAVWVAVFLWARRRFAR